MDISNFLNSTDFTALFFTFLVLKFTLESYLKIRNISEIKRNRNTIPHRFTNVVTPEEYEKSTSYNTEKLVFDIVSSAFATGGLLLLTLGGLLNRFTLIVMDFTDSNVVGAILLGLLLIIFSEIIQIPLSIYSTFTLEQKYGFNTTTKKIFVQDVLKGLLISGTISSLMFATVVFLIDNSGDRWWVYAFIATTFIQILLFFLYPVLIMPLFNKFEPLDDEKFKIPIEKLLEKVKFKSKGLFVMNASLRSTHGNAFFTGFGKMKRIVFFDTLLKTISPNEMEAILGHELGHSKLGHIRRRTISVIVSGFLVLYILSEIYKTDNFFISHGLTELTAYSKFIMFNLVIGSYTFITRPISSYLSRKAEFQADDFSFQYTDGEYLISGLLKLTKDNASNLTPDPLYSAYYYSHPPIAERINSIEEKIRVEELS